MRASRFQAVTLAAALCAALAAAFAAGPADAQETRFFRIGTGSISGVYFPVGGLLANVISNPQGSRPCEAGGSCGVPGLIAVAQATLGSVANARAVAQGAIESGLVQADIAAFAYRGEGPFASEMPMTGLRAIANLYPEAVHVVVRRDGPIRDVSQLRGQRVSLDLAGSGTRTVALMVLEAHGLAPADLRQVNSQIGPASDRIRSGALDAFFFVGGYPVPMIQRLARDVPIRLLQLDGKAAEDIRARNPFMASVRVPAGIYRDVAAADTLAVGAQWLVSEKVAPEIVYGITRALWHPSTQRLLDQSVPAAAQVRRERALEGLVVPLHPGALRYYREQKIIQEESALP